MSDQNNLDEQSYNQFSMVIEDIFVLKIGLILAGQVQSGMVRKNIPIVITGGSKPDIATTIAGFEGFLRDPDNWIAMSGDNTAIHIRGVKRNQVEIDMIVKGQSSKESKTEL